MTKYDYKDLEVNGVELLIVDEDTKKQVQKDFPHRGCGFTKIPSTEYYVYHPIGGFTSQELIDLSGMEKYGVIDPASDVRALNHPANKKYLDRAKKEGRDPMTFYPKNHNSKVTWLYISDLKKMALDNIKDAIKNNQLHGYDTRKCCFKNKKVASRSTFPKVNVRKMF